MKFYVHMKDGSIDSNPRGPDWPSCAIGPFESYEAAETWLQRQTRQEQPVKIIDIRQKEKP